MNIYKIEKIFSSRKDPKSGTVYKELLLKHTSGNDILGINKHIIVESEEYSSVLKEGDIISANITVHPTFTNGLFILEMALKSYDFEVVGHSSYVED